MEDASVQASRRDVSRDEERDLSRDIDAYLLGFRDSAHPILYFLWYGIHIGLPPSINRNSFQERLLRYRATRLHPLLERSGLAGELAAIPEETFRERLLHFRCYLAEPDEPSEELLGRLRLTIRTVHTLIKFLTGKLSLLELEHTIHALRKSLAAHAPELHTLLYDIAEQMSLVGENSPEDLETLQQETEERCYEWLNRLFAYYYALLG